MLCICFKEENALEGLKETTAGKAEIKEGALRTYDKGDRFPERNYSTGYE